MQKIVPISLAPAAVLLIAALLFISPLRFTMGLYPLVRQAAQAKLEFETRHYRAYETPHFVVRYQGQDSDMAQLVARAAEASYKPVTELLGQSPKGKALIIMHSDKNELGKAFGWSGTENAMGVYWGGVIQVLSPRAWMQDQLSTEEFIRTGPMAHEFTHLVFDHMTNGNYPRWFTEGLAQYVEYRITGFEWRTPANALSGTLYTQAELDANFDDLPNQSLAYRQSFAAVRYIAEAHGDAALQQIIAKLRSGVKLEAAIKAVLNMNYREYETAWRSWANLHYADARH